MRDLTKQLQLQLGRELKVEEVQFLDWLEERMKQEKQLAFEENGGNEFRSIMKQRVQF